MDQYEVDEAMLGPDWIGGDDDLREFVKLLNAALDEDGLDVEAVAITDSFNGAKNDRAVISVSEDTWERVCTDSPNWWWRSERASW